MNPTPQITKPKFIFDGESLSMSQTIEDAGLEDEDQVELKLA